MKAILEFNLPEDQEEFNTTIKANAYACAIHDISEHIFRPARKHGYSDARIQELIDKLGADGQELVGLLEAAYYDILREYEVA